jgi:hypothetical protein
MEVSSQVYVPLAFSMEMASDTPWMQWMAHTGNFQSLLGIELLFRGIQACTSVTILTCLFQLLYGDSIESYYII